MVRLTREVRFSVDRDWAGHIELSRPIANSFGGWPSAVGLVPYLRLRATVAGEPDRVTGYLCNISLLDRLLREHAIPFAAERLRRLGWRESAERLLASVWERVAPECPAGGALDRLELMTTPFLSYAIEREAPEMVFLTQQFEFSAAHRLHSERLTAEQNRATFGKCNNPNGHGHNYVVEVTIGGRPDPETGVLLPLPRFERVVQQRVIDLLDHRHLNLDVEQFRALNPSVENLARVVWELLAEHVSPARLHRVRVCETPKTWADYSGGAHHPSAGPA